MAAGKPERPKRPDLVKGHRRGVSKDKQRQICKGQTFVRRVSAAGSGKLCACACGWAWNAACTCTFCGLAVCSPPCPVPVCVLAIAVIRGVVGVVGGGGALVGVVARRGGRGSEGGEDGCGEAEGGARGGEGEGVRVLVGVSVDRVHCVRRPGRLLELHGGFGGVGSWIVDVVGGGHYSRKRRSETVCVPGRLWAQYGANCHGYCHTSTPWHMHYTVVQRIRGFRPKLVENGFNLPVFGSAKGR
ncbi:hypothetical protein B0H16DRAFT_1461537 [Mycena metata]|uniref:Uncharacterized protein n=1 Tax=Mycena metata TaxID=1033252 RepID=A0AAD7IQW3_9AGAR|nr:hypothetical protein B0H16DRAFT_1461537 [Mycena metata]